MLRSELGMMDDDSLITYSTSMELWKFAYLPQGTCKVDTGILNKKAMELEFKKLPVKPVYSPIFTYSNSFVFFGWRCSG
jgi:hypothetical protein